MRAPFQVLVLPFRAVAGGYEYCIMRRSDSDIWQFIAGGGEGSETPEEAAVREAGEEAGIYPDNIFALKSKCYIPTSIFSDIKKFGWNSDTYVIPEYSFAFECNADVILSAEHKEYLWIGYDEAHNKLKFDSNRTAMYELEQILINKNNQTQ